MHRRHRVKPTALPTTTTHEKRFSSNRRRRSILQRPRCSRQNGAVWLLLLALLVVLLLLGYYVFHLLGLRVPVHRMPSFPEPKTIPFPDPSIQISVVIMNYGRPRMLQSSSLLPTLCDHPNVQTIFLCHANALTQFHYDHAKVQNIHAVADNAQYGLALRFWHCRVAPTQWVLIIDDDMECYASTINELIAVALAQQQKGLVVGKYGRSYNYWKVPHRHGYEYATKLNGTVEVVLTKLLLVERSLCEHFFRYEPLVRDLVQQSSPYWNGEDIFLNLVANHVDHPNASTVFRNVALPELQAWEASNAYKDDDQGLLDINGNMDRHTSGWRQYGTAYWRNLKNAYYRGWFWYHAKKRLQQQTAPTILP